MVPRDGIGRNPNQPYPLFILKNGLLEMPRLSVLGPRCCARFILEWLVNRVAGLNSGPAIASVERNHSNWHKHRNRRRKPWIPLQDLSYFELQQCEIARRPACYVSRTDNIYLTFSNVEDRGALCKAIPILCTVQPTENIHTREKGIVAGRQCLSSKAGSCNQIARFLKFIARESATMRKAN